MKTFFIGIGVVVLLLIVLVAGAVLDTAGWFASR